MGAGHDHGAGALSASTGHRRRLATAFFLILTFFVVEVVAGLAFNSLALLSDAGHMFTDVLGLGMALAAMPRPAARAARRIARSASTAWRCWRCWPTPSCSSVSPSTCSTKRSAA